MSLSPRTKQFFRRNPARLPRALGLVAASLALALATSTLRAHERTVLPLEIGETPVMLPVMTHSDHLERTPVSLDFGDLVLPETRTLPLTLTNATRHSVSVSLSAPPGVTPSTTHLSVAPGGSAELSLTWAPDRGTVLDDVLELTVDHDGVAKPHLETVQLRGQAGTVDLVFDVPTFRETNVDTVELGLVSTEDIGPRSPLFEVTITNAGTLDAKNLEVLIGGPGRRSPILGDCNETVPHAAICVAERVGTNADGTPEIEARSRFGDLAAGASITTVWRVVPWSSGSVDRSFDVTYEPAGSSTLRTQPLAIRGEVIASTIPGDETFFRDTDDGGGSDGFGASVDPLADDALGTLRPTSFDPRTVFSVGDVDAVDLRTGNLTLTAPIGGRQVVRGNLGYELTAVFNGRVWHRKTVSELLRNRPDGTAREKPLSAQYPNPAFNLGTGWSLHLGRLLPPLIWDGIPIEPTCPAVEDVRAFEKVVDTGPRFVYIDPSGTSHEFWTSIHGADSGALDVDRRELYRNREFLYTRDGSHLRLVLESPTRRVVEEPTGIRHIFVERANPEPTLPDTWRLEAIEDPYGNRVSIEYGPTSWQIRDHEGTGGTAWRTVTVHFADWDGMEDDQPMVVSRVDLPGFDGGPARSYGFTYGTEVLAKPPRSAFHAALPARCPDTDTTVRMPRLDAIDLPDGSRWSFQYEHPEGDGVRLRTATLPTGADVDYEYFKVWDSPPDCFHRPASAPLTSVARRTVRDAGGDVLEDRRFLRETLRTADVPEGICGVFGPHGFGSTGPRPPWSEQTVVVWNAQQRDGVGQRSTASVHHFNIYPYNDDCGHVLPGQTADSRPGCHIDGTRWRLDSGRTHIERNLKISHTRPDPLDARRHLSEEIYSCDFGLDGRAIPRDEFATNNDVGDDVSALLGACQKRQTVYAQYEVSRGGQCRQANPHCMRTSRLKASRTVYHDDGDRWVLRTSDDYDGLGHYRRTTVHSNFQSSNRLEQTSFRGYNPDVGTLELNDDHTVKRRITLPTTWLLETWDVDWNVEGSQGRGGEARFHPTLGHMTHRRTWAKTAVDTANIAANRSSRDLVVHRVVDDQGELDLERFLGADTYAVPNGDNWHEKDVWNAQNQDYAVDRDYQFGFLAIERVVGDSTFETRRTIDQATGWPVDETLDSGEVRTFGYDSVGRTEWITSTQTASQHIDYQQQGDGTWELTATVYPKNTTTSSSTPTPIRVYDASYDGLGRLGTETLPRYNDSPAGARQTKTRNVTYHPSGAIRTVSALDVSSRVSRFDYDFRGRPLRATAADGSKASWQYSGVRIRDAITCIDTGGASGSGICTGTGLANAETKFEGDFKGRVIKTTAPEGFATTFTYDPNDQRTSARRVQGGGPSAIAQRRSWTYDGLGFLTQESLPERVTTVLRNFNTRGQAREIVEGGRTKNLTYDRMGRLRRIAVGSLALKRFVYCDPETSSDPGCDTAGGSNGQLIRATRNNYRLASEGGIKDSNGVLSETTWLVESTFQYDEAARPNRRSTSVWPGLGRSSNPSVPPGVNVTTFDQGWRYDDLGNVTTLIYPECNTASVDCTIGRQVSQTYRQGFFLTNVAAGSLGAALTYHASGLVHQVNHRGGGGTDVYGVANGMPRIASMDLGIGTAGRLNLGAVAYDYGGNITAIGSDSFTYDRNSRLTSATLQGQAFDCSRNPNDSVVDCTYDNFDNLTSVGTVNAWNNQLTGPGWNYDSFGNLIDAAAQHMAYDELDKLKVLETPSGARQLAIYDHDDLRILAWSENDPQDPERRWSLRDGLKVIREYVGLGSQIALRRDSVYAGSRLLSAKEYPSGHERHYHEDQVGSARLITGTNPCGNASATSCEVHYDPFGQAMDGSGERTVGFQGHEDDGLTTYMRGRTYLPFAGRFLQVDPARDAAAWSQYAFVGNNPISRIDPTGNESQTPRAADFFAENPPAAAFFWLFWESPMAKAEKVSIAAAVGGAAVLSAAGLDLLVMPFRAIDSVENDFQRFAREKLSGLAPDEKVTLPITRVVFRVMTEQMVPVLFGGEPGVMDGSPPAERNEGAATSNRIPVRGSDGRFRLSRQNGQPGTVLTESQAMALASFHRAAAERARRDREAKE